MLSTIKRINLNTLAAILYVPCEGIQPIAERLLKKRFDVATSFTQEVKDEKELNKIKNEISIHPLLGTRWMLIIDVDKVSLNRTIPWVDKLLYSSCLVVYRTAYYGVYKQLSSLAIVKQMGPRFAVLDGGFFYPDDIKVLTKQCDVEIDEKWFGFMSKHYGRDTKALHKLCTEMHSFGFKLKDRKSIIYELGLGRTTTAGFALKLLNINPKNQKGRRMAMKGILQYLNDLALEQDYTALQNFILDTMDGFIDIKIAYTSGYISSYSRKYPPYMKDEKRRKRYDRLLQYQPQLQEIALERIIKCRSLCKPTQYSPEASQVQLIAWIMSWFAFVGCTDEVVAPREQYCSTDVPLNATFKLEDISDYMKSKMPPKQEKTKSMKAKTTTTKKPKGKTTKAKAKTAQVVKATEATEPTVTVEDNASFSELFASNDVTTTDTE